MGDVVRLVTAVVAAIVIMKVGIAMLRSVAAPPVEPDEGELRRVAVKYRCSLCGTIVRMTMAPSDDPAPPRHCQEDMDLVAPIDD